MKTILLFLSVLLSANIFGQNVYIPDANFKAYLVGSSEINTSGDTEIQVSEANAFTGEIHINSNHEVQDIMGIEAFTALTSLYFSAPPEPILSIDLSQNIALKELRLRTLWLTGIDLSQNTELEILAIEYNNMEQLDLSNNTELVFLDCTSSNLTDLNVSHCTKLETLICVHNSLSQIDLSNNTLLQKLNIYYNELTVLNLSMNTELVSLGCGGNALECLNIRNGNNANFTSLYVSGNLNLTCIEVDDANFSTSAWGVSFPGVYSEDCDNACSISSVGLGVINSSPKTLTQILDLMGRETTFKPNIPLIYVYDDGSIEKVFSVEY